MKLKKWTPVVVMTLFAALSMPVGIAAQDNPSSDNKPKHKKYRLVDMGTFGGPASYLATNNGTGVGSRVLNNQGIVTGAADTPFQDPYAPNCVEPDCFLSHTFRYNDGVVTDLGALPGDNNSEGNGINERGWIAGVSQYGFIDPLTGFPANHAVLWKDNEMLDLGTLGGYWSGAWTVNDAGEIIGGATINAIPDPYSFLGASIHTFLWKNGVMRDVGTLGGPDAFPGFSFQPGVAVGASFINSIPNPTTGIPTLHPFLWKNGRMQDLGTLGGTLCCQETVVANSRGQVASDSTLAGDLVTHPFLWDGRRLIDLGTLGGTNGVVNGINDRGEVVGFADLPGSQTHDGFLWRNGVLLDLGNLGRTSSAWVVNSQGQVVGASRIDDTPGNVRAFLWEKGGPIVDLNALIPQNSPLTLVFAVYINERGEIPGLGVPAGCEPADYLSCGHAYLLIPDGDCDGDCQNRVDQSHAEAELRRQTAPAITQRAETPLSPIERLRSQMRQRYHLPGQPPAPRD